MSHRPLHLCSSCASWDRGGMQHDARLGVCTAPCLASHTPHMGDRPLDQRRGSDACGKWSKIK